MGVRVIESGNIDRVFELMKDDRVRSKAMKKALRNGAKPVVKVARAKVPIGIRRKTGKHLKATIGTKIQAKRGQPHIVVIGARLNRPWKGFHHHLVEKGRKAGPGVGEMEGTHYMERAFEVTEDQSRAEVEKTIEELYEEMSRG